MIGADPERAKSISFTNPYLGIEAGYLVPSNSPIRSLERVDAVRHRVAAYKGSAYELWLGSNLRHATLVHGKSFEDTFERFRNEGIDALASLKPKLIADQAT